MALDALIFVVLLFVSTILLSRLELIRSRTEQRLKRIEFLMNLTVDHLGIDRFPEEIKEIALDSDPRQRLKAVKLYVTKTGATLQEAVRAVEEFSSVPAVESLANQRKDEMN
jgi:hypothetical protein